MSLSRRRSNKLTPAAALLMVLGVGVGELTLAQTPPPVRRALPVTEPPVPRALPVDGGRPANSPRPAPPPPNNVPSGDSPAASSPAGEGEPADRRQLDYATALYGRKLYDLA